MSVYQVNPSVIKYLISSISIWVTVYSFAHVCFTPKHRYHRTFDSAKFVFCPFVYFFFFLISNSYFPKMNHTYCYRGCHKEERLKIIFTHLSNVL